MAVTEETEQQVRELRQQAEEYAERVRAGEEPWREDPDWRDEGEPGQQLPDVRNDDVGETGDASSPQTFDQEEDDGA